MAEVWHMVPRFGYVSKDTIDDDVIHKLIINNLLEVCLSSLELNLCYDSESESLLTASVPPAQDHGGTLLAAEFQNLYGFEVATALRYLPALDPAAVQASKAMSSSLQWISASVDYLARRLEKLKRTDIQTSVIYSRIRLFSVRFLLEFVSRSVKDVSARLEFKQNALAEQSFRRM
ncbi:hypothetical protein DFJ58DRAFT_909863 [Suillus subalutaceus]|uniref:uncharacterized protein n=1 Tax=Suillus subalutaceus TaxID=48586 RepID=UPI001B874E3A|nr:uncharacterized protein DFJ58DRAFT_909863 [Suillus subalutaceus]KAG1876645.1 hypothetical protein DFJ58DRAFT_909863 [Suillus subalutaceus]